MHMHFKKFLFRKSEKAGGRGTKTLIGQAFSGPMGAQDVAGSQVR
ncbi:hypothetical protein [Roseovarius spongiae]|nr:hypothetical protein [Roseovarius spongiae]